MEKVRQNQISYASDKSKALLVFIFYQIYKYKNINTKIIRQEDFKRKFTLYPVHRICVKSPQFPLANYTQNNDESIREVVKTLPNGPKGIHAKNV